MSVEELKQLSTWSQLKGIHGTTVSKTYARYLGYTISKQKKIGSNNRKANKIFRISFGLWNGAAIPELKKPRI